MSLDYVIKWRHGERPEYRWFIRAILKDGSFYGEITRDDAVIGADGIRGRQITVEGQLSPKHVAKLKELAGRILIDPQTPVGAGWTGLLAEGSLREPAVIFRYNPADEVHSPAAADYLQVIDLLKSYLGPFYKKLG
jgi:hypothetical protein